MGTSLPDPISVKACVTDNIYEYEDTETLVDWYTCEVVWRTNSQSLLRIYIGTEPNWVFEAFEYGAGYFQFNINFGEGWNELKIRNLFISRNGSAVPA